MAGTKHWRTSDIYLDKNDPTRAWSFGGFRMDKTEFDAMIKAGDVTQEQVNRFYNNMYTTDIMEYKVRPSSYSKRKKYFDLIKTRPATQADFTKWLDTQGVLGMKKIGGQAITKEAVELINYVNAIHAQNAQNFGLDPTKYKMFWSNSNSTKAIANAMTYVPNVTNNYIGAGRIKFFPMSSLNARAMATYARDPLYAETLRAKLFKTAIHESLHLIDFCMNDHLDAFINLEMATMERYGYKVLSYGRHTTSENGRYIAEFMNVRTGKIYKTSWDAELFVDKKAFDTALAKYEKEFALWLKKNPNATDYEKRYFFKETRPTLSNVTYADRIADGNKTIATFTNSKVGGAKATKAFREPNINDPAKPWSPIKDKPVVAKQSAVKKVPIMKAIQTSASTQAWTFARQFSVEIKRRALLAFQFGKNVGMGDAELLNHIRNNLEKYTANPNNLGGNVVANGSINNGRMKAFKNYEYRLSGYEYNAILDARTTETCEYLHGKTILVNDGQVPENAPPNHFGCRSILIPITITDKQPDNWTGFEWDKVQKAQATGTPIKIGKKTLDPNKIIKQKNL